MSIDGYQDIIFKSRTSAQGGGVGFYIKQGIKFRIIEELTLFEDKIIETMFIEIQDGNSKTVLGSIYRSNTRHPLFTADEQTERFTELLMNITLEISKFNCKSYIFGDFNIDLLKFQTHLGTNTYLNNMFSQGFIQIITKPTRVTHSSATLIDHLWTNATKDCYLSGILTSRISDHFPIFHIFTENKANLHQKTIHKRDFSAQNISNFKNALRALSWSDVTGESNAQKSFDLFSSTFNDLYTLFFPVLNFKFNKNFH